MARSGPSATAATLSSSSPLVLLLTFFCFFGFSFALDDLWLLPGAAALSSAALLAEMPSLAAANIIARVRPTARRRQPPSQYTTTTKRPSSSLLMRPIESPVPLAGDGSVLALGPKQTYPGKTPGLPHQ